MSASFGGMVRDWLSWVGLISTSPFLLIVNDKIAFWFLRVNDTDFEFVSLSSQCAGTIFYISFKSKQNSKCKAFSPSCLSCMQFKVATSVSAEHVFRSIGNFLNIDYYCFEVSHDRFDLCFIDWIAYLICKLSVFDSSANIFNMVVYIDLRSLIYYFTLYISDESFSFIWIVTNLSIKEFIFITNLLSVSPTTSLLHFSEI